MELIFENRYVGTREIISEYLKHVVFKTQRILAVLCAAASAVLMLLAVSYETFATAALAAVFLILCIVIFFLSDFTSFQVTENTRRHHYGTIPESVCRFTDQIELTEGTDTTVYEYAQITAAYQSKNIFVLQTGNQNTIILKKDAFTVGTSEAFPVFILQACKNLERFR